MGDGDRGIDRPGVCGLGGLLVRAETRVRGGWREEAEAEGGVGEAPIQRWIFMGEGGAGAQPEGMGVLWGSDKTTGGKNTERTGNKNTKERLKLDGGDIDAIEELVRRRLVLGSGERGERRDTSFIFSNCWFVRLGMVREGSTYVLL